MANRPENEMKHANGSVKSNGNSHQVHGNNISNGDDADKRKQILLTASNGEHASHLKRKGCPPELEESVKRGRTKEGEHFLTGVVKLVMNELMNKSRLNAGKVVEFVHPKDLEERLDLSLTPHPTSSEQLISLCEDVVKYSVKSGHGHFFNQLYAGMDGFGLAGAWLTDALNTSQYTFEVAPVFTLMEKTVLGEMLRLIGFKDGDAIFCPGGSISNMYAINLARYQMFPEVKQRGQAALPKLCIMTSEKGHYSLKKGAAFLGLGMDNVLTVKTDQGGRMSVQDLKLALQKARSEGYVPFMVNATAGSTVLGAYDPLDAIATVCQEEQLWMHVDAAWGGGILLSEKLRHKMRGVDRADSVAWNPHKMMGAPLQCAAFLTRHKDLLRECHSAKAKYLFQQDKFYDVSYDTGDKSVQCGRKVDVLKLWMLWKAKGSVQFAKDIENLFHCAGYVARKVSATQGFRLVISEPECTNVCFWFIPPSLRGQKETEEWWQKLSKVAPVIKQRMTERGTLLIGYQPDGDLVNFFRLVISNVDVTEREMDFAIDEIARLGADL